MKSFTVTHKKKKIAEIVISEEVSKIRECKDIVKKTLHTVAPIIAKINKKPIEIFILATRNTFVKNRMNGVSGSCYNQNEITIYCYPTKNWKKALKEVIVHEVAHALGDNFNKFDNLGRYLVQEGIAEHFREHFVCGGKAKWVKAVSKKRAKIVFNKIKPKLNKDDDKEYRKLFFGSKEYPKWIGYTIGYYLVKSYLDDLDEIDWMKILKESPDTILRKSKF